MNWKEKLADLKYRMALAHDGVQIEKDMRRQAVVERLIKKTQDGTLQNATTEPMDKQLEDEMAVRIGDESHVHYHTETKPVLSQPQPSATSSMAKTLAAAGLAAAGLGAGAALPIAAYQMFKQAPTNVIVPTDTDTDTNTQYGLRVYRDDESKK